MLTTIYRLKCGRVAGALLTTTLIALALLMSGCGGKDARPIFGDSFTVIKEITGDSYMVEGYSHYFGSRSGTFAPNAVLVVGVKEGVDLGGIKFDLGAIIVVEGTSVAPTFRLATPDDKIIVIHEITVFGKMYKKGRFAVPSGGKLTPS